MLKYFKFIIFLGAILFNFIEIKSEEVSEMHICGYALNDYCNPVLINPELEKVYLSKIKLDNKKRNNVFFSNKKKKFIIIANSALSDLKIYSINIFADELQEPLYVLNHKGYFLLNDVLWNEKNQTVYLLGLEDNKEYTQRDVVIYSIDLTNEKYNESKIQLNKYLKLFDSEIILNDSLLIIGYDDNSPEVYEKNQKKSMIYNLLNGQFSEINFSENNYLIYGTFDDQHIAVEKNDLIYSYDFKDISLICPLNGIAKIFGYSKDKKGFYARILKSNFFGETNHLAYCSVDSSADYKLLFNGKYPYNFQKTTYITKDYLKERYN